LASLGSSQAEAPADTAAKTAETLRADDEIIKKVHDDDPKVQAEGLDELRKQIYTDATGPKSTPAQRTAAATVDHRIAGIVYRLNSNDWTVQQKATEEARGMEELGPGVLKAYKPPTPGSIAKERDERFEQIEQDQKANGTYTGPAGVWDKVNHDIFISRSTQFPPGVAEMVADQIIAGNYSAAAGFGRSPQLLEQLDTALLKRMADHKPPLTGGDLARTRVEYAAYAQGLKAFEGGGKLEPIPRSLGNAVYHLDLLQQAHDAVSHHDINTLNMLHNALLKEFGLGGPPTFDAIKQIVAAEVEKAVSGSAGAVTDREELKASLSKNLSPPALQDVIRGYEGLMASQLAGLRRTYDRTMELGHQPTGGFDQRFLDQHVIDTLKHLGADGGSSRAHPPRPVGMTDVQIRKQAQDAITAHPDKKEQIEQQMRDWQVDPSGQ
jgi:hypothetical protein